MSARAQAGRIARLLGVAPEDLAGGAELAALPEEDLRSLHDQIGEAMFGPGRSRFARIATLSERLPGPVAGRLAEAFLPPVVAAQVSVELEPERARELVGRVSIGYLADLTVALDPARSAPVVQALPPERIGDIAAELYARREYAAMAEFAGTVDRESLRAALDAGTAEDLLAIVPLLTWTADLDQVVADLDDDRIDDMLRAIVDGCRWQDAELLAERLPAPTRERLVARAGEHLDRLAALEAAAARGDLGGTAAELVAEARRRVG